MAKVVVDTQEVVVPQWWDNAKGLIIGVIAGLIWWLTWSLLRQYALDVPSSAGGVAHILTAVITTLLFIRLSTPRPLLISVGSAALLWSLGGALAGLGWGETLLWSVGLFAATYALFHLIAQIRALWLAVVVAVIIVVGANIFLAL